MQDPAATAAAEAVASSAELQILDALPVTIAVLAKDGTLAGVNEAWWRFAIENGAAPSAVRPGVDYLAACDAAAARGDMLAAEIATGLRRVLQGELPEFTATYPCHGPSRDRWYLLTARPLPLGGAVLRHLEVTETTVGRARLEKELESARRQELVLRDAVEWMSEGLALYDASGSLLYCNSRYLEFYAPIADRLRPGITYREVLRLALAQGLYPDGQGREDEWMAAWLERLRNHGGEQEHRLAPDRWVRTRVRTSEQGLRVAILTDVTESKRREAQLYAGEARFRDLAEIGADCLWELDADLRFTFSQVPRGAFITQDDSVLGLTLEEVAARGGPLDESWQVHLQTLAERRPFRDFRFRGIDAFRRPRHFRASGRPRFDADGRFLGYRGVLTDETETVEAKLRAERAETHLRAAVEKIPQAFVIYDRDERLVLCNEHYREMYDLPESVTRPGSTFEEALRAALARGAYPEAEGREEEWMAERLRRHREPKGSFEQRVGGRWVLVEENRLPDGGVVGTRTDVTAVKRSAEQALQAERLQALGTLAGGIAHDFNNLLSAIIGYGELALDDLELGDDPRAHLEQILAAGRNARDLVKQILRFGSLSEEGAIERCHFGAVVEQVVQLLRPTVHPDIALAVGIGAPAAQVLATPAHLSQVVMNLAVNAVQAIGQRRGRVEFRVDEIEVDPLFAEQHAPLEVGPCVRLIVRDDGPGIEHSVMRRVFEPFFTTKEVGHGTGMGLPVVHGIVARYQGAVSVYSERGAGAEFHVYLPCVASPGPARPPGEATDVCRASPKGRALVVDDMASVRQVMARMLERLGYDTVSVGEGAAALAALDEAGAEFDLVVTDQVMPTMNGADLAAAIRSRRPDLPVLLCTGFGFGIDEARLASLGRTATLGKPFTIAELAGTLASLESQAHSCMESDS